MNDDQATHIIFTLWGEEKIVLRKEIPLVDVPVRVEVPHEVLEEARYMNLYMEKVTQRQIGPGEPETWRGRDERR